MERVTLRDKPFFIIEGSRAAPRWRHVIELELGSRKLTASLTFMCRQSIVAQLLKSTRNSLDRYRLIYLRNEVDKSLGVVWCPYVRHAVSDLD